MSFREEQMGKFFMGGSAENYKKESNLILPSNPFEGELKKLKEEKESEELKKALFEAEKAKQLEINEKIAKLEMLPMLRKVIIQPYPVNPYRKVVEGSLIVEFTGAFRNFFTDHKADFGRLL